MEKVKVAFDYTTGNIYHIDNDNNIICNINMGSNTVAIIRYSGREYRLCTNIVEFKEAMFLCVDSTGVYYFEGTPTFPWNRSDLKRTLGSMLSSYGIITNDSMIEQITYWWLKAGYTDDLSYITPDEFNKFYQSYLYYPELNIGAPMSGTFVLFGLNVYSFIEFYRGACEIGNIECSAATEIVQSQDGVYPAINGETLDTIVERFGLKYSDLNPSGSTGLKIPDFLQKACGGK